MKEVKSVSDDYIVKISDDLPFTVVLYHERDLKCYTYIKVFEIVGRLYPNMTPIYREIGATSSEDIVYDIENASPLLEGFVKWDGYSQFSFLAEVYVMGKSEAREYSQLFPLIFELVDEFNKSTKDNGDISYDL